MSGNVHMSVNVSDYESNSDHFMYNHNNVFSVKYRSEFIKIERQYHEKQYFQILQIQMNNQSVLKKRARILS